MDWLQAHPIIASLISTAGVPLILWGINTVLPKDKTHALGFRIGRAMSVFGQKKAGKHYESVENRLQTTLTDFVGGIMEGLDSDDKTDKISQDA